MAEGAVTSAATWLGKLLVEELSYLDGVRGKVERLRAELNTLAAFLSEAVKSRRRDEVVRAALAQGRDIAYDCQDVIETYILELARRHGYDEYEGCQVGSAMRWACLLWKAPSVHAIGSKIDGLNERIAALKSTITSYVVPINAITDRGDRDSNPTHRRVYTHEKEELVVVGLENHLSELVGRLLNPTDRTVIVVSGMGGVGKSTLARELYHHPKLRRRSYFQAFGWASASQQLQPDRVLQTIMYSLVPENDHEMRRKIDEDVRADRAHARLYKLMKDGKCLVVIDDIWTAQDWAKLQAAFPRKNPTGSRIVLTTRNQDILSSLDPTQVHLHPIKGLDEKRSWKLFQKTAFLSHSCTDSKKEELGRDMLRHCSGVPLAIVVLGKILRPKERVEDWLQMRNDIFAQIRRGGAPNNPYKEVYDVLQVSYDELPLYLKHCFLHFANFPEDYEVTTSRLYQIWVAEGIVSKEQDPNELEEDIAERYLKELVSRNMAQASSWVEGTDRIRSCRLHDLMRDVCMDIAHREGFLQPIHCQRSMLMPNGKNAKHLLMTRLSKRDKRLRRLAVYVSSTNHQVQEAHSTFDSASANVSRAPNLRSLLLFSVDATPQSEGDCKRLMETISIDFPLLRVFDCEDYRIGKGKLPNSVGDLIHLRYLSLANTHVTELPSSIEKLRWLQTLDLRVDNDVLISIPNTLWKMKQLRHLYLPFYGYPGSFKEQGTAPLARAQQRYLIRGGELLCLDGLYYLQTLVFIDLDRVDVNGLSRLRRLNTLYAACATKKETLYPFLQCSSLRSFGLTLHARIINEDPLILSSCKAMNKLDLYAERNTEFHLRQPLCLEMLPRCLVRLDIWYLRLDDDPLPVLEKLPNLLRLNLRMCYDGQTMACGKSGFPELTNLRFDGLRNFSHWEVEQGALLKLKSLQIVNCRVRNIPNFLTARIRKGRVGTSTVAHSILHE